MTFDEARAASLLGLKVRRAAWKNIPYFSAIKPLDSHGYRYQAKIDNDKQYYDVSFKSMVATDWEIYKEDTKP
ncbi:hypothetical protein MIF8_37 [Erwinia phage MIF8]